MKTIVPKSDIFKALFSRQNLQGEKLRLAGYCRARKCDDGVLMYNGLSREFVLLTEDEFDLEKDINLTDSEVANYLKNSWFYIPESTSSTELCEQFRTAVKSAMYMRKPNNYKRFVITTTLECNARCFYCFQAGRVQPRMSPQTAHDVANFIITHSEPNEELNITWFGGEPLCNTEAIDIIASELKKANRNFVSKIISNGYLFNQAIIDKAKKDWNLKSGQITLDGTENIYNRSKNYIYKDVESPFRTVISNIELLLKNDIKISIRLNLGIHNKEDIFKLADFLTERFSGYDNCHVYAHRLFDYDETGRQIHKEEEILKNIEAFGMFNDYIYAKKMGKGSILNTNYKVNRCTGDSDTGVVISPVGKLTKCEHFSDEEVFGTIYSEELDTKVLDDWKRLQPKQEICEDCPVFMNCFRICKCPDLSPKCTVYEKNEQIGLLDFKMINTYKKWKKENEA